MIQKYRAWKDGKCYENVIAFEAHGKKWIVVAPSPEDARYIYAADKVFNYDNVTIFEVDCIESSTGRQDKNGMEIYEGDKIKNAQGYIGFVEWDDDRACYQVGFVVSGQFVITTIEGIDECEIIGNIHEEGK